jgi:hypothetical protein
MSDKVSAEAKLEILRSAVAEMREHQRAFFAGDRSRDRLNASKRAEGRVDKILGRLVEERDAADKARQGTLF